MNKLKILLIVTLTFLLTVGILGCQTTVKQRVPAKAIIHADKEIYLSYVSSEPRTYLDILAINQRFIPTNHNVTVGFDPAVIAVIADAILKNIVAFSNNAKDIQENTATRNIEIFIKGYDLNGTNVEKIVKIFSDMTGQTFPTALKK